MTNSLPARASALVSPTTFRIFCSGVLLALGLGTFSPIALHAGPSGGSPTGIVAQEIARRQKLVDDAILNIGEGDELIDQRKFAEATLKYFTAYSMTDDSALAKPVHDLARSRFASFSVIYARELAQGARYADAHKVLDRVLSPEVAPDHEAAKIFKTQIDDPERFNPAVTPEHLEAVSKVNRLFEVAEGHMQLGNFDMANLTYAAILREDKTNQAARRGMAAADLRIGDYHDSARSHFRAKALSEVDKQWELQVPLSQKAFDSVVDLRGTSNSSAITDRMRNIIVPKIDFTDETLGSAVEFLTRISEDLDPTGTGVNFLLQLGPEDAALRDLSINLTLNNVPLGEVVRFISEQTRTKFRIEQFAVVITSLNSASTNLITKDFGVPPDFLRNAPGGGGAPAANNDPFGGGGGGNAQLKIVRMNAQTFLERSGVAFPPGSSASHIPSTNTLFVRNTQTNIDQVEAIVDGLMAGNQNSIRITVRQIEVSLDKSDAMSFDHLLGMFNLPGSSSTFGSGAGGNQLASNFAFTPPGSDIPVGQNSLTSGIRTGEAAIRGNVINDVTSGRAGLNTAGAGVTQSPFAISAPFADPQYQIAIRALNQEKVTTVANQATTVTRPGQRAVIEGVRNFIYPTEYDPPEIPQTFNQGGGGGGGVLIDPVNQTFTIVPGDDVQNNSFPVTPAHPTAFDVRNVGTRFEVEPTIDPNGYTVTLNMSLEFAQFEGFINYGTPIIADGVVLTDNRILQPLFRVSKLSQPVHVNDGANFVIGGIIEDDVEFTNDKTPFLGDVPLVGRLFKGNVSERRKKAVLFFVRVQIISPDGTLVNQPVTTTDF